MKEYAARSEDRGLKPEDKSGHARFLPDVRLPEGLPPGPVAIADMANAFGVTHRTLHFYEEKNLIKAGRIGLMRVYSDRDVHLMAIITLAREVGMPIATIQDLLKDLAEADSQEQADSMFIEALMVRKRELIASLSTVHRQMQQLTTLIDRANEEHDAGNDNDRDGALTEMEIQCLELMAEGLSPVKLARAMAMELRDAQALENGIIQKFNAHNRFQAVAKAVLLGIIR